MVRVKGVDLSKTSFQNDFRKLPDEIRIEAGVRIASLVNADVVPAALRFHRLQDYKPNIYTIDVWPKMAYKASFNIVDGVAVFRRIGTHKSIDRSPE